MADGASAARNAFDHSTPNEQLNNDDVVNEQLNNDDVVNDQLNNDDVVDAPPSNAEPGQ
jgi:hypothetical protein